MHRAIRVLSIIMLVAAFSPAEAKTPLVFSCRADATLRTQVDFTGLTWEWVITTGRGICKTIPASQKYDVTIIDQGLIFPSGAFAQAFMFEVKLRLKGRLTKEIRSYVRTWVGKRLNCTYAPFVVTLLGYVPHGEGNMQYCGPIPKNLDGLPQSHPAVFTWTFLGT